MAGILNTLEKTQFTDLISRVLCPRITFTKEDDKEGNKKDVAQSYQIVSVSTFKSVNRISQATITLRDGSVANTANADGNFPISNLPDFEPGSTYSIKGTYEGSQGESVIFKGVIIQQSIKSDDQNLPVLELTLRDSAVKMTIQRSNRSFSQPKDASGETDKITDADVISKIAEANGMGSDITITGTTLAHSQIVQYYCTDWDFIVSRAEMNGMLVFVDDGKIEIKQPAFIKDENEYQVIYGRDIVSIETCIDVRHQYPSTIARSWDSTLQDLSESNEGDTSKINIGKAGNLDRKKLSETIGLADLPLQHSGQRDPSELQAWADASIFRSELARIRGTLTVRGTASIKPGAFIDLQGMGDRLNGQIFVSGVTHTYNGDEVWHTTLEIGLDHKWFAYKYEDIIDQQASALVPAINGLQSGVVQEITGDPAKQNRVLISLPIIQSKDGETAGIWARLSSFDAGAGAEGSRGSFFFPEIGDEVIVGFMNDDPRDAIILGSLYSAAENHGLPEEILDGEGNIKLRGFISKKKLEFTFDEEEQKITLKTPGNKEFILQDGKDGGDADGDITIQDANGNSIIMNKDGITIQSDGDIVMKSTAKTVTIEGSTEVKTSAVKNTVEGTGNLDVSGGVVSISGSQISLG